MTTYTIILLRPAYLCDDHTPYGKNIYVAQVSGSDYHDALMAAQLGVYMADTKDGLEVESPGDYALCVLFEGHHDPKLFGWQSH